MRFVLDEFREKETEVEDVETDLKKVIFKPYLPTTGDITSAQLYHNDPNSLRLGHHDPNEFVLEEPLSQNVWIEGKSGRAECDLRIEEKKIIRMMRAIASGYRLEVEFKKAEEGITFFALTFEKGGV